MAQGAYEIVLGSNDPYNNPQQWDVIQIGGTTNPGICQVGEFKRGFEWDVKKGKGTLGATITFTGRPPAKGSIKFLLWEAQHFVDWDAFLPQFKYSPTKQAVQAVTVYHPSLAAIDLSQVVTESIGNPIHEGGGLFSITVEFLEYFPPPSVSATSTPTMAQPNTDPAANPPDPYAAQQAQIASLLKEAQAP
jgi:hypothetical protein